MSTEQNSYTGNEGTLSLFSKEELLIQKEKIIQENIPVFRMNTENKLVVVPLDRLEQYLGDTKLSGVTFYIDKNRLSSAGIKPARGAGGGYNVTPALARFGKSAEQAESFGLMPISEREELLDKSIESLHALNKSGSSFDINSVIKMVEVVATTFYSNYVDKEERLGQTSVEKNPMGIYVKTEWIVRLLIEFFKTNSSKYTNYRFIDDISTGSHTIDNISKGVLWFIGFCIFYNDYIDKGMVSKKLRGDFKDQHLRFYKKRFPDQPLSVERVVKDGLRRIEMTEELTIYSMGALLYDIGKIPSIDYHDGVGGYDDNIVKIHVLTGYNMIQNIRQYPYTVSAMAAFHHEYYGGKGSYNFTNPIVSKLLKKKRTEENASYFITYDEDEFKEGLALAFFPCKVIEIIDVYNALVYKKANSPTEALRIMKKNFIAQNLKIDPILFDIFLEFKVDCGILQSANRREIDEIRY